MEVLEVGTRKKCDITTTSGVMKYHPSIMEKTFLRNLLIVSNEISAERKHAFLHNFCESLKKVFTCLDCGKIGQENSKEFSCGHFFCETCSRNLSFCSKCKKDGHKISSIIVQSHTALLSIVKTLQTNFNVESVFFEMLKFFLTPTHRLEQRNSSNFASKKVKNSPKKSQRNDHFLKKFTSDSKRFKTPTSKKNNFKKKIEFSQHLAVMPPHTAENDSECLFVNSNKNLTFENISKEENLNSYLEQQPSIDESRISLVVTSPLCNRRKAAKRKKLSKNNLTNDAAGKRCPKKRKACVTPKVTIDSEKLGSSCKLAKREVSDICFSSSPTSPSLSSSIANVSSTNAEGTFIGFNDSQICESYQRFQTAIKCFEYLKSMEDEVLSNITAVFPSFPNFNCVDILCRAGYADSRENVGTTFLSSRFKFLENEADESFFNEMSKNNAKNFVNPVEMLRQTSQESDSNNLITADLVDDIKELVKAQHEEGKDKENFVLSLPDPEMEEAIDLNLWRHNEKVTRKKKSLMFKSVKERNRPSLLFDEGAKLHLTEECVNSVRLGEPIPVKQTVENSNCQINDVEQSSPRTSSSAEKNDDMLPACKSDACNQIPDIKLKIFSNEHLATDSSMRENDEARLDNERSVGQICPAKLDVELLEIENEERNIQVSRVPVADNERDVTSTVFVLSPPSNSNFETFTKIDDDIRLQTESSFLNKNKIDSPVTATADLIPPSKTKVNINIGSLPTDTDRNQLQMFTSVNSVSINECNDDNNICDVSPKNYPNSLVINSECGFSSVEVVEKSDESTVITISDTVAADDDNCVKEPVTKILSQSVTISSSNSESPSLSAIKINQTADTFKIDETVNVDGDTVISNGLEATEKYFWFTNNRPAQTKLKCAKLKKVISDQNEKLLKNIRTSFNFISPNTLSVKKGKGQKVSGSVVNNNDSSVDKDEFSDHCLNFPERSNELLTKFRPDTVKNLEKSVTYSVRSSVPPEEMLTVPASPRTKSVSCQTTRDLHITLLQEEFPHLFNQRKSGISTYDIPEESALVESEILDNLKTPQLPNVSRQINFTAVSSITSSQKKIYENLFTNRSVLDDSLFHCPSTAENTIHDISIQPLPSTGKKGFPLCTSFTEEKLRVNTRLTFEFGPSNNAEMPEKTPGVCDASSTPLSHTKAIYCSSLNSPPREIETEGDGSEPYTENRVTTESNEIEPFNNNNNNNNNNNDDRANATTIKEISREIGGGNQSTDNVDGVSNLNMNLNASSMGQSARWISRTADANHFDLNLENNGIATPIKTDALHCGIMDNSNDGDVDYDNVEFIAGTPTSYSKRCVDNNLEKLMTQSFSLKSNFCKSVLKNEKPNQGDSSKNQLSQLISHSLTDSSHPQLPLHYLPPLSTAQPSVTAQRTSLDLFSSSAINSDNTTPSLVVVMSGLKDDDVKLVKLFCRHFSVSLSDRVTPKTTHLVVKTNQKNRTARTFKYLQAIVYSIRVVSIEWTRACIKANEILNEEKFVPFDSSGECGPLRAYNAGRGVNPSPLSWLRDYCLFFMEPAPAACTLIQLHEIVEKTGAIVITELKDFKIYATLHHLIIVSDEEECSQTSNTDIANWLQIYQAVAIEFNWLLEVIGRNRLVPFAEYELVEIPPNLLLKLNFPNEMLQYEKREAEESD